MKIDAFAHIMPPKIMNYLSKQDSPGLKIMKGRVEGVPTLFDLEQRFRVMDKFPDRVEVLTLVGFSVDELASDSKEAIDLAKRVNDEMAELVFKYPNRFAGAAAVLSLSDMDTALIELDRAINELNLRGLLIRTPISGKPIDLPEFIPMYERMHQYNLPIWLHPVRKREMADYPTENESKYDIFATIGLPYETSVAMLRLTLSGILERYPDIKIITHHCGAMIPYFAPKIANHYNLTETRFKWKFGESLPEPLINYLRRFYNDTAIVGNTPALMCAYHFFGADHLLFASDMPFDPQIGEFGIRTTIEAIEQMNIPDNDKRKIFENNARELMRLPI